MEEASSSDSKAEKAEDAYEGPQAVFARSYDSEWKSFALRVACIYGILGGVILCVRIPMSLMDGISPKALVGMLGMLLVAGIAGASLIWLDREVYVEEGSTTLVVVGSGAMGPREIARYEAEQIGATTVLRRWQRGGRYSKGAMYFRAVIVTRAGEITPLMSECIVLDQCMEVATEVSRLLAVPFAKPKDQPPLWVRWNEASEWIEATGPGSGRALRAFALFGLAIVLMLLCGE